MFNPIRYVDNNFEDPHLSDANLRAFCEDHLVRLAQPENNPGSIYSTLLADATTKYTAYYGKMSNQAVKEAIAEGATITRNNARKSVQEKIDAIQGFAKIKYGETSAEYQEMYPIGMMEYTRAHEGNVGTLFDRFVVAVTARLNADYPAEVLLVTNAVTAFHAAYTARETVVSQVDSLITGKNSDRISLTEQLTKNFLIIASNNVGNTDKFDDYYDIRFLPLTSGNGNNLTSIVIEADALTSTINDINTSGFTITPSTTIQIVVSGNELFFSAAPAAGPTMGSTVWHIFPGTENKTYEAFAALVGASEINTFLKVQCGPGATGHYKITFNNVIEGENP